MTFIYICNMNRIIILIAICLFCVSFWVRSKDLVFTPVDVSHGLSDNQIRYISQLSDGRMVFTTSGNVNLYDGVHFTYIHRTPRHIYPLNKYDGFYRVYQEGDSLLWIKDKYKLSCLNLRKEQYITNVAEYFRRQGITEQVGDIFVDDRQRMWLLTTSGLFQYDTLELFDVSKNQGDLQDLAVDNDKLYLFYDTGEVICYNLETKRELYRQVAYSVGERALFEKTSLVVKGESGFYQLRNGNRGGFFFFDPVRRVWEKILETDYVLNTLILSPDGKAYISCSHGFWTIDLQNREKKYMPVLKTVEGNIIDTEISTLYYDKQGGLWLGTLNRGLLYYHPLRYKFTYIGRSYFEKKSVRDFIVQAFTEDEKGNIYVQCQSDIYQYLPSKKDNKVLVPISPTSLSDTILKKLYRNSSSLFNKQYCTTLLTDIRGWRWTGTSDGLRLSRPEAEIILYTKDGLSNNFIHALCEDRKHNIWVTTSYGISQIKVDSVDNTIHIINFNTYDGTLKGEYADGAVFEARDGTLYFGGINGFNILKPDDVFSKRLPFKPVFTNLFLRGEKVEVDKFYDDRIILSEATHYTQQIELAYNQNFLTFEYSALNYQNPYRTFYRYKLEGVDVDWQEMTVEEQRGRNGVLQASYTNLSAGKYTFKVMASNDKYQWSEAVAELHITIYAPWWRTTTAYIVYVFLLLLIIFVSFYLYTCISRRKIENKHKEEMLLFRIRSLIEQCNQLELEKESSLTKPAADDILIEDNANLLNPADSAFLAKAIDLVEKNLDVSNYSVEQLSHDLCMDRTGLYRKLITLLDQSPSLFIRSIRLRRAAQLLLEGELNITEITDKVGFSSSSYLSRCFQEMYGCRPSEYAEKVKKST